MTNYLTGKLKKIIAKKFHGKLMTGTISRKANTTVDQFGDPVPGADETYTFEGIRDSFDAVYAAQAGIPDTDVSILILLGTIKPNTIQPRQSDFIQIGAGDITPRWHQVRKILTIDPADASMTVQATEVGSLP